MYPKMKYKGKSISYQRVKGKKPPKIEIVKEEVKIEEEIDEQEKELGKSHLIISL
jgi:ribosomal protein L35AE/L33A